MFNKARLKTAMIESPNLEGILAHLGLEQTLENSILVKTKMKEWKLRYADIGKRRKDWKELKDIRLRPEKRLQLLVRRGYKEYMCEICGISKWINDTVIPLFLHYKDGNKDNTQIENLQLVCGTCRSALRKRSRNKFMYFPSKLIHDNNLEYNAKNTM